MSSNSSSSGVSRYRYDPSLAAAIVAAVLYGLAFVATVVQWCRFRAWVWLVMLLAAGMEAVGWIVRCFSVKDVQEKNLFVTQFALVFLSPVLMAAACYVVFGRIVFHVVPREERSIKLLWISPRFVTPFFVIFDIISLFLQIIGALMITTVSAGDPKAIEKATRGKKFGQAGVAVQLVCFGFFTIIALRFNWIAKRFTTSFNERISNPEEKYVIIDNEEKRVKRNWGALLHVTNVACALILIRSIYRIIEFSLGRTGYPDTHEWCLYVFDALPILPVLFLYAWWHPAKYLPYLGYRLPKHAR